MIENNIDEDIKLAIFQETQAFLNACYPSATVAYKTDFNKNGGKFSHGGTWVLLHISSSGGGQYIGNVCKVEHLVHFNAYNYMPDVNGSDMEDGYSMYQTGFMRAVRQHFVRRKWLGDNPVSTMPYIMTQYGFKWALSEVREAEHIEMDGLSLGEAITMDCIALDVSTSDTLSVPLGTPTWTVPSGTVETPAE
jgi:hypothetical protein